MKARRFLAVVMMSVILALVLQGAIAAVEAQDATAEAAGSPFEPTNLKQIVSDLTAATAGKVDDPSQIRLAIVVNVLSPFWTAAAIGEQRASSELGAPVVFEAPDKNNSIASQQSILESMVTDQYDGIAFSAVDPSSVVNIVKEGMAGKTNFLLIDSDSPNSGRPVYFGLNNYNGGVLAAQAMLTALDDGAKCGTVIGFVGFLTAQNAIDRIQGIKDTFKGTNCTFETVLADNGDPSTALSNAETAITTYPDAAGFIGLYSYDGPAIGQALISAGKVGEIKLVSFDLEPGTLKQLQMSPSPVSAAIGQRVYYYGYLTTYMLYSMAAIGKDATLKVLDPYLSGDNHDSIDAGADVVTPDTLPAYQDYLTSLGIKSQ
ncbi:MAG: substrate-binding domain-containing protein [Chloroflexi bacterium]|nr:substrate-binding domain-containing protein [Chloroflexota bacterium]